MQEPSFPPDEAQRLAALRDLGILDTPAEARFDRITRIAQRLFDVPVCLVSLVDEKRQWFKSRQGLDAEETPRNISFCGHAILDNAIFCIPDASTDGRFADNPLVIGPPDIRFYAGAPLQLLSGHRVGTLCIIDQKPRVLSVQDRQALRDLADWVQDELQVMNLSTAVATLREDEQFRYTVVENVMDGIITLDAGGRVRSANPAAQRIFGAPAHAVVGASFADLLNEPSRTRYSAGLESLFSHDVQQLVDEVSARQAGGDALIVELSLARTRLRGEPLYIALLHDISARRRIEQLKNDLVSTVSHELRTPLTSIRGSLGLIAGGQVGALPEAAQKLVAIAERNSERLIHLINDILDIDRIESGKLTLDLRNWDVLSLVKQAVEDNQGYAAEFDVRLTLESSVQGLQAHLDQGRFIQIMSNLLSNAIKYSPPGGEVRISLQHRDAVVRIVVKDQGPGIPASFQSRLFSKFSQADASSSRQQPGAGLGLCITKTLVERQGGCIDFVTSSQGTTFMVDFTIVRPAV